MRGGEWIVPVVAVIVYLISTILKSRANDEPVRRPPVDGAGRKPSNDIDRFLQEIDRLRRKTAEEQGQTVRAVPQVRPAPPAVPRVRPVTRLRPATAPPNLQIAEAVPVVTAAPLPASEYIAPIRTAKPLGVAQVSMTELRQSPGVTAALHLLRSPRTLAAAVVLQEMLGPPKCKRH